MCKLLLRHLAFEPSVMDGQMVIYGFEGKDMGGSKKCIFKNNLPSI
jgi:hypothetical protein